MQIPRSHQTGTSGIRHAQAMFEDIGWGAIENTNHDVGTGIDLFLLVRGDVAAALAGG